MLEIILTGALATVGLKTAESASEYLLASIGGVGTNWASSLAEQSYQRWRAGWFSERGALNHDIAKALARAFNAAAKQIYRDWHTLLERATTPEAIAHVLNMSEAQPQWLNHLRRPDQRSRLHNQLRRLHEEAQSTADELITLEHLNDQIHACVHILPQVMNANHIDEAQTTANTLFVQKLRDDFFTNQPLGIVEHIAQYLYDEWMLRFREELKDPSEQGTRAWRAYQLLWQQSLAKTTVQISQISQTTDDIREVVLWLQEWAETLQTQPANQRDPTGDDALDTALQPLHESMQHLKDTLTRMEQTITFIDTTTQRTEAIATRTETGVQHLEDMMHSLHTEIGKLTRGLAMPDYTIQAGMLLAQRRTTLAQLREGQTNYFERHTLFAGRDDELAQIRNFLASRSRGYVFITGPSGYGKTALIANLVAPEHERYCWYFLNRLDNTHRRVDFLRQMCEQMLSYYQIEATLPPEHEPGQLEALYAKLLRMPLVQAGRPLVLVIDGLDEAEDDFIRDLHIPRELPTGKFIIFSAREQAGRDDLQRLGLPQTDVLAIRLETLDLAGIEQLLLKAIADSPPVPPVHGGEMPDSSPGPPDEREMPDSLSQGGLGWEHFLQQILRVSQGDPFYVRYLVKDIANGRISEAQIAQQPAGLESYLDGWWQQVSKALRNEEDIRNLLGILMVALGPLPSEDLFRLYPNMEWFFDQILDPVRRFVIEHRGQLGHSSYALCHPRFQNYLTKRKLKGKTVLFLEELINYCLRWTEHHSRYALRHYAQHLQQAQHWQTLYDLAENQIFQQEQATAFPTEPNLPLRTIQVALEGAATCDDAGTMARMLLLHVYQAHDIAQESPLDALREGNIERAWALADLVDAKQRVLWYLLLAWELHDNGHESDARKRLERVLAERLPRLDVEQAKYAVMLLPVVSGIDEHMLVSLQQQLLDDYKRADLCDKLAERHVFAVALQIAQTIDDAEERAKELADIATAQAQAGLHDDARQTCTAAFDTAQTIDDAEKRAKALADIATAQAQAGLHDDARQTCTAAFDTAQTIDDAEKRAKVLEAIATAQAQASDFSAALHTAQMIDDDWDRAKELAAIVTAQARVGYSTAALHTAQTIDHGRRRVKALSAIVTAQARAGDFPAALQTVQTIDAEELLEAGDLSHFKQLLIPCAYSVESAYAMCELLAQAYPAQVRAVVQAVTGVRGQGSGVRGQGLSD